MIFHENCLLADNSHDIIYHTLFLLKIRKDVAKFVVCCSRDWRFKGYRLPSIRDNAIVKIGEKLCHPHTILHTPNDHSILNIENSIFFSFEHTKHMFLG